MVSAAQHESDGRERNCVDAFGSRVSSLPSSITSSGVLGEDCSCRRLKKQKYTFSGAPPPRKYVANMYATLGDRGQGVLLYTY